MRYRRLECRVVMLVIKGQSATGLLTNALSSIGELSRIMKAFISLVTLIVKIIAKLLKTWAIMFGLELRGVNHETSFVG